MSAEVRILVDPVARRWQVADRDAAGMTVPAPSGDTGIAVGRDRTGAIVEIVIDAVRPGPAAVALVGDVFGPDIANMLNHLDPEVETDMVVAATRPTPSSALVTASSTTVDSSQRWMVDLGHHTAEAAITPSTLRLVIAAVVVPAVWVRVTATSSGALLAILPVRRDASTGDIVAEGSFCLEVSPHDLKFDLVDDPLRSPSATTGALRARIDALLDEAAHTPWWRAGTAERLADEARALSVGIGDVGRQRVAERLAQRRRTVRRWLRAATAAVATAGVIGLVAAVMSAGSPSEPSASTAVADPGPITTTLSDGTQVTVSVVGAQPVATAGATWMVGIQLTTTETGVFGDATETEATAQQRCRAGTPVALSLGALRTDPFEVRIDPVGGGEPGVVLGIVPVRDEPQGSVPVPDTCSDLSQADGQWVAQYSLRRAGHSAGFDLPAGLTPGIWDLSVTKTGTTTVSVEGQIRLQVEPAAQ